MVVPVILCPHIVMAAQSECSRNGCSGPLCLPLMKAGHAATEESQSKNTGTICQTCDLFLILGDDWSAFINKAKINFILSANSISCPQ